MQTVSTKNKCCLHVGRTTVLDCISFGYMYRKNWELGLAGVSKSAAILKQS